MTESYRDKLNEIDHKCLDEDLRFYDLRSLFESVAPKLSAEDKEEIKKVIQNTNDAETIAAVLQAKAMDEKNESLEESFYIHDQSLVDDWIEQDLTFDIEQDGVYSFINASEARKALETAMSHGYRDAWRETNKVYISGDKVNESLEEKLIDAPQEVVDELINILNKYGFVLDDSFKVNPGKTFMGDTHMQVINPESLVDISDEIDIQDQLQKYVTQDLIDEIHDLDQKSDCPITWNFGPNKDGQVTGGLDIMKQYVEESYKDVYYVIMDKHGNQLSRPTKDDSELWDRVESRDPKGTRGLKVVVYTGKVDEKLDEASYGGAYDIEDDMFFTKEELMEFAGDLAEQYCAWANHKKVYIEDLYIAPGNWLTIELFDDDEGIYIPASVRIDMRKIKLPKDIYKYSDIILKQWKDSYNEYHDYDESLNEAYKHLNNREKQVYIDIINNPEECEDIDDLKDIVHEIFFYDKALFAMMNRFPKDASFEELKANKIAILKDSMLTEDYQYKIGDEVRAGSERSIQRMLYKNNYLREDYNSFLTLADKDANKLRNEYDKGDKSIFDILTSLNYIQDDPDSVYMYKEVSDGYAIVFDLSSLDEGKNYVKYFVVDENNNIPKGYTITKLLIEDYQQNKDEWGEPYSYDEVERELKSITNNWTDKEGTIRCYWEQEKNYGLQILKKHYKYVETSDGRTGKGEDMSWVISYSSPKEN